jgi:transcriptional regulator with XRE-family HTH domain
MYDYKKARRQLGLSQVDVEAIFGLAPSSLSRMEKYTAAERANSFQARAIELWLRQAIEIRQLHSQLRIAIDMSSPSG